MVETTRQGRAPSRRRRLSLALALAVAGSLALAASAPADVSHVFTTTFGAAASSPANPYPLSNPASTAVDNSAGPSAHDVYVTDPANSRVEKFDPAGNFILMFGDGVDQTTGADVCTAQSGDTCQAGASGSTPGAFTTPTFIAVDGSAGPSAGDVYVVDTGGNLVSKFDPSGNLITSWGKGGQLDGSTVGKTGTAFGALDGVVVDSAGNLFVYDGRMFKFAEDGTSTAIQGFQMTSGPSGPAPIGIAVDSSGQSFYAGDVNFGYNGPAVEKFSPTGGYIGLVLLGPTGLGLDLSTNDIYIDESGSNIGHYLASCEINTQTTGCPQADAFGSGQLSGAQGLSVDSANGNIYVANTDAGNVAVFDGVAPSATTAPPSSIGETSVQLSGHIDPIGRGDITDCHFEYIREEVFQASGYNDPSFVGSAPCVSSPPVSPFTAPTDVTADIANLSPGTRYRFRLIASNSAGAGYGFDRLFSTPQPPTIEALSSSGVTATSADLHARINPQGLDTTYQFEYGTSIEYGSSAPVPAADIGSGDAAESVSVHLAGLQSATYHFRVVATNALGTTASEDQTFDFLPPDCPNGTIRQQTAATYLPDCRAYELVSPADAKGTTIFPLFEPLNSPTADNTFLYGAALGVLPETGDPENDFSDTYAAKRTGTGWVTRYVGIPAHQTRGGRTFASNLGMDRFLVFDRDSRASGFSNFPYVYDDSGNRLGQWPTNRTIVPGSEEFHGSLQPSPNLTHLVISSNNVAFAPNGLTVAPGSAYDFNTVTNETSLISKTPSGADIQQEPSNAGEATEAIEFPFAYSPPFEKNYHPFGSEGSAPGVSTDGSHILMATAASEFSYFGNPHPATHLYMRVDDSVTYDVSRGHDVHYVGMTTDATKVFFVADEQLTSGDQDTSTDLYMWSEAGDSLTLVSKGANGEGNSDACSASWTGQCNVAPVSQNGTYGTRGTDRAIAAENGDIYFYSPEQLDGSKGVRGRVNLYDYRDGQVQFVAALAPGAELTRINVSPDDGHAAFLTASRLTAYDNAGHQEMYTYNPASGKLLCASCVPSGAPPSSDVEGSEGGLFMSDIGSAFFYTADPLVPQDTNRVHDVYEYVDGRPQLITTGTGDRDSITIHDSGAGITSTRSASFLGVTADGIDVYFSTFNRLVAQDENGNFLKIYDARSGGGFPFSPPPAPCVAADECHGAGSEAPGAPAIESGVNLGGGGNAQGRAERTHRKRKKHHARRRGYVGGRGRSTSPARGVAGR